MNKKDIILVVSETYSKIDVVYRRSFWIIFGVLCFAFGFHTIQFMWGNHDWPMLVHSTPWGNNAIGRYALHSFKKIFLNGIYLPLISDVVSFFILALNAVMLCIYWKLEKRIIYFVLCGLILTVQPYTLSLLYFIHMIPESFIGVSFILVALILSEKMVREKEITKKVSLAFMSVILINLSLAMYPVLLNTIAVASVGGLLIQSFEWDGSWKQGKSRFIPFTFSMINIALGIIFYKIILTFVFPVREGYNTKTLTLNEFPERLDLTLKQSFQQLYEHNSPFISQTVLLIFLGATILVALYICLKGNIKQKIVRLILLGGTLYATQTVMLVADAYVILNRIELFGLVVFETLIAALAFTKLKRFHNLTILVMVGVVWVSIINDLDCLRVWKLGFDAEKMLWNRVLARLEIQKDFDKGRKYKIITIGPQIALRHRFYSKPNSLKRRALGCGGKSWATMLDYCYDPHLAPFMAHDFYYQTPFKDGERFHPNDIKNNPRYKAQIRRLWEAGVLDKAKAWPHENGLIVWKDVILFVTDIKVLENYKRLLAKEFPRQQQKTQ